MNSSYVQATLAGTNNYLIYGLLPAHTNLAEFAQHALEFGAHCILEAESAGDFAGADFALLGADKSENVSFGGEGRCRFRWLVQKLVSGARSIRALIVVNVVIAG